MEKKKMPKCYSTKKRYGFISFWRHLYKVLPCKKVYVKNEGKKKLKKEVQVKWSHLNFVFQQLSWAF